MTFEVTGFSDVNRNQIFVFDITVFNTEDEEEVTDFYITANSVFDSGVNIEGNQIFGSYDEIFNDTAEYKYVSRGSSDLLEEPKTVYRRQDIPAGQDLFSFLEFPVLKKEASYDIYDSVTDEYLTSFSHDVNNNFGSAMTFLTNYFSDRLNASSY